MAVTTDRPSCISDPPSPFTADEAAARLEAALATVADLTKINRLMVESARRLSSGDDPEDFLESLVRTLAESIGASPVSLFEHDAAARSLTLRVTYLEGKIRRGPSGDEVPLFATPFPADITPAWAESVKLGGRFFTRVRDERAVEAAWPGLLDWFTRIGVSDVGHIVLFVGDEPVGSLGISWTNGRRLQASDCPVIEAFAQQAALALRLVKLSEQARDSAVSREQESAARVCTAELARANDALQRSTSLLVRQGEPAPFLETVLLDICAECGAKSAGAYVFDPASQTAQLIAWVCEGERGEIATDPRLEMWRRPHPVSVSSGWDRLGEGDIIWYDVESPGPNRPEEVLAWHRQMGHRIISIIPLIVGSTMLGVLALGFPTAVQPTPARFEQSRTLAGHAALALQLTRLAREVRQEAAAAATLGERNRIARDLHDTLAQGFTGILAQLGVAEGALAADGDVSREMLHHAHERAAALARTSLAEARRSVGFLREEIPPSISLADALRTLLERTTAGTRLHARLEIAPGIPEIPPRVGEILRRIAQEALTNSLRHAGPGARAFLLAVTCRDGRVVLIARDDGCGFDPQVVSALGEGYGLLGMRERAALAGGVTTIRSAPGEGVEITVELPFTCPADA